MDILRDDLLKNKYFLFIAGVVGIILLIVYVIDYNSLENQCRRSIEKAGTFFQTGNKLQETALEVVMRKEIKECVKRGNK